MGQPLRILYAAGPGNVIGTYEHWKKGRDDPSEVNITYSGQFYDLCRALGARSYVIARCPIPGQIHDGPFTIKHRPVPFSDRAGLLYHIGQVLYAFQLIFSALAFRADVAVIETGSGHWFVLALLPLFGVNVIPSLLNVLWLKYRPPTGVKRFIHRLDSLFFGRAAFASLSMSPVIANQLAEMTHGHHQTELFLPVYRKGAFVGSEPLEPRPPFRVFFAGRIEQNKGVFELLEIAGRFAATGREDIEFDLCGSGSMLAELRRQAEANGLGVRFRCHGHCNRTVMREMFARAHAVVAPTTSGFLEGFNQVVVEGVLAGRPVITSAVCPALEYVRDAVVEVAVDDTQGYAKGILKLCDDDIFYDAKRSNCTAAQAQFYDSQRGWGATLKRILAPLYLQRQGGKSPAANRARSLGNRANPFPLLYGVLSCRSDRRFIGFVD